MILVISESYERYTYWCIQNGWNPRGPEVCYVNKIFELRGWKHGTAVVIESLPSSSVIGLISYDGLLHQLKSRGFIIYEKDEMARKAYVYVDTDFMYLYTPYIEELVDDIRDLPAREWLPDDRCWKVPTNFRDIVDQLLSKYFKTVEWSKQQSAAPDWLEELFKAIPVIHQQRVYRALAVAFHPDTGGSPEMMRRINEVYDKHKSRP